MVSRHLWACFYFPRRWVAYCVSLWLGAFFQPQEKAAFWRIQQWPASIAFWRAVPFTMGNSQKNR
ncbi:unnamed protein product, partial [Cladocopium goreaui]